MKILTYFDVSIAALIAKIYNPFFQMSLNFINCVIIFSGRLNAFVRDHVHSQLFPLHFHSSMAVLLPHG